MNARRFDEIVKIARAACSRPTIADQNAACAPIGKLSPEDKVDALCKFVDRAVKLRSKDGYGDWTSWVFCSGVIPWREKLPWTRAQLEHVLEGTIEDERALPPEVVVRAVEQFVALQPEKKLDPKLAKLVDRVARAMWPPGSTEGVNFKKAAAKLKTIAR